MSRRQGGIEILSELGGDGEALLLYDMQLPFGIMRVAEHFSVSDGRIDRIRQIHDTHPTHFAPRPAQPRRLSLSEGGGQVVKSGHSRTDGPALTGRPALRTISDRA